MPVEKEIKKGPKPVLHISVHSFTPILNGVERDVDIGLLFDPARRLESRFCENIKQQLDSTFPSYRTQFNKPYLGIDDGFTSYLRTKFNDSEYAGIEVEISQNLVSNDNEISKLLVAALKKVVNK